MYKSGESFPYFQCESCGCLQISQDIGDMSKYYPEHYYSYAPAAPGLMADLKLRLRTLLALNGPAALFKGKVWFELGHLRAIRDVHVPTSAKILDVGCGSGLFMSQLRDVGYTNVSGVDPFLAGDIVHKNGVKIRKCDISEVSDQFDVVLMNHSLEHIWDQKRTVADIHRVVKPGGKFVIRIPTCESDARDEYGAAWAQLDPPRHFYLHSRTSIARLLAASGFRVVKIVDDPSPWSLLGSEKVKRGLPLMDPETNTTRFESFFSPEERADMWRKTLRLSAAHRGDQITVHAERV